MAIVLGRDTCEISKRPEVLWEKENVDVVRWKMLVVQKLCSA